MVMQSTMKLAAGLTDRSIAGYELWLVLYIIGAT